MLNYQIRQPHPNSIEIRVTGDIVIVGANATDHTTRIINELMNIERTGKSEPFEPPRLPLLLEERLGNKEIKAVGHQVETSLGPISLEKDLHAEKVTDDITEIRKDPPAAEKIHNGQTVVVGGSHGGTHPESEPGGYPNVKIIPAAEASQEQQPETPQVTPAGYSTYSKEEDALIEACETGKEAFEKYVEQFGEGKRTAAGIKYHFRQLKGLLNTKGSSDRKTTVNYNPWSPDELEILKNAKTAAEAWDLFHAKYPESQRSKNSVKGRWYAQNPKGLNKTKLSDEKRRQLIKESRTVGEAREKIQEACGGTPHPGKLLREFQELHQEDPGHDAVEPTPAPAPEQPPEESRPATFREGQHVRITCHEKERYVGATGNIKRVNNGSETCIVRVFSNDELIRFECLEAA